jgi:hypothetical protein
MTTLPLPGGPRGPEGPAPSSDGDLHALRPLLPTALQVVPQVIRVSQGLRGLWL